jgi:hypothetical protein
MALEGKSQTLAPWIQVKPLLENFALTVSCIESPEGII